MKASSAIAVLTAAILAAGTVHAREITDAAGRTATIPDQVERVFAAGPPASIVLYTLAPEKMLGWSRAPSPEEGAYLPEQYRDLPAHGRLTGRGNDINLERLLALKPDLVLDIGSVGPTYASLADRVVEQTGVPAILLGGPAGRTVRHLPPARRCPRREGAG
ncbi:hypothetical protein KEU06_01475 [Pseudaminobacter sp. 19-2017]|uniref:Fe/B12 periplasmic-binding domain-containing protein n=1 Tax=Pseudaminobacter soli (ex Zhang et al. 2022) TaxID=2831468 RepID=A0A942DV33_9HYPH|nr:hypothetical protein [Pseudaminobacter soli]MBS3647294.1 hypothetical protein [Pseudaminobacter soli]